MGNDGVNIADKLGLDKVTIWSFSEGVAEGTGGLYIDLKLDTSAEMDTQTCCIECKVNYDLKGGLGYATGRKWKRGFLGVELNYEYKGKADIFELNTNNEIVLFHICPGEPLTVSLDQIFMSGYWGGHILGEIDGSATFKPMGKDIFSAGLTGTAEIKGGINLGLGITAEASWNGGYEPTDFSIDGNVWINANVDSHILAKGKTKLSAVGAKWEPEFGNWEETWVDIDPDSVGWNRKPLFSF